MSEQPPLTIDKARHTLSSGLLHDLRTPLNHVIGYSELLIEAAREEGQDGFVPHLQKVCAAGHHLLALINDNFDSHETLHAAVAMVASHAEHPTPFRPQRYVAATMGSTAAGELASAAARGSLLVVDDIEADRETLSRHLQQQGYAVATAENGRQALNMLHAGTFDLVLLDIMMPEMDGYEVLRRLRADDRLQRIPVIVISALTAVDSKARCIEMGAEDCLSKPFHPALLKARIRASLERKRAHHEEAHLFEQLQEGHGRLKALDTPPRRTPSSS